MSDVNPTPVNVTVQDVKDDPAKPWKAIMAFAGPIIVLVLTAIANSILEQGDEVPPWLSLSAAAVLGALLTFSKGNPKVLAPRTRVR